MFNIPWREVIISKINHESHVPMKSHLVVWVRATTSSTSAGTGVCEWAARVQSKPRFPEFPAWLPTPSLSSRGVDFKAWNGCW